MFRDGIENYIFQFLSAECKSSWEAYFGDAKQKLGKISLLLLLSLFLIPYY